MGYSWEMYLIIDQVSGDFLFKIKKPALLYFVKKCEFFSKKWIQKNLRLIDFEFAKNQRKN